MNVWVVLVQLQYDVPVDICLHNAAQARQTFLHVVMSNCDRLL